MKINFKELDYIDKLKVFQALNDYNQSTMGEKLSISQSLYNLIIKRKHKPSFEVQQKINKLIKEFQ
ncbi:hypothetical protein ACT8ZR_18250 [Neobacillus sp. M.A.Huq-85]